MNRYPFFSVCLIIFIIFTSCISVNANEDTSKGLDIIIKINRIHQAMNIIDKMAAADLDQPAAAPSFFLRSFLFGTDWIDPSRPIVIGINFKNMAADEKPVMAALVPYVRQNEDFHISYNAVSKIDHYIVSLPPEAGAVVSDQMAYDLAQAATKNSDGMLSAEIAISQLLNKADSQVRKMILELDSKIKNQAASADDLTPEDVNNLLKNLISAAKQLETFSMGIDLTESELTVFSNALALKGTALSKLFKRNAQSRFSHMDNYAPARDINFKSASYDIKGMLTFFNSIFGTFYKKIGLDLADIESMASRFTGEMAGGISLADSGMKIEMIAVLNDGEKTDTDFLDSVYIPWMMNYGQKMAAFYNQHAPNQKIRNIFTKTSESTLNGKKVFNASCKIPVIMPGKASPDKFNVNFSTTVLGRLLITAADDERLKQLIALAGTLEKKPYDGPLMKMDINLGAYLKSVQAMMPDTESNMHLNFSNLGSLVYTFNLEKREISNKYVIQVNDIRSIVSAFKQASADAAGAEDGNRYTADRSLSQSRSIPTLLQNPQEGHQPAPKKEDTAEFWLDKGLLYATYGNDKEAIRFYEKALQIEPDNPGAFFNIGISYSSLGQYDLAVNALNKALLLSPDNGDYHYGLGWVYLLKGESGKAMEYIRTAADLGNPDAIKYLKKN